MNADVFCVSCVSCVSCPRPGESFCPESCSTTKNWRRGSQTNLGGGVSQIFFGIFIPIPSEMIQFDVRIFFKGGWFNLQLDAWYRLQRFESEKILQKGRCHIRKAKDFFGKNSAGPHCTKLETGNCCIIFAGVQSMDDLGVSLNGGTPNLHSKMIIFSRKTNGCWVPLF